MLDIGKTLVVGSSFRATRNRMSITLTELANAGKRGKKVDEVCIYDLDYNCTVDSVERLSEAVAAATTFADAAAILTSFAAENGRAHLDRRLRRGVDVAPGDVSPIEIDGPKVHIKVDWDSFSVRCKADQNNLPTLIPRDRKATSIAKFRALATKDADTLMAMTFGQVWDTLRNAGIDSHYFCAMD